jgi:hypothetical protein
MPKFDGVDAILGDLVNGPSAFNRVPGAPRQPGIEGFGLWAGALSPPAVTSTAGPVRKRERAVFDADPGARFQRQRRDVSDHERWALPTLEPLEDLAEFDGLDNNLECADSLKPAGHGELVPFADDPVLLERLASLDRGVFGDGRLRSVNTGQAVEPLGGLAAIDRLDDNLECADSSKPEAHGEPGPLADDPGLIECLASLDRGVFGDGIPGSVDSGQAVAAIEGLAALDRLDDNLDVADSSKAEAHDELAPLADDPVLLEGLAGLDRGVFGDVSPHDRRIQRYELKTRLIAPEPPQARPSRRSTDLPGLVANVESVRVHRWVAAATLALSMSLGAAAAAFVFQQQLSRIAVRWNAPAQAAAVIDACAATDCLPERNR